MLALAYQADKDMSIAALINFVGGTDETRLDLRIGVKDLNGNLYSSPSFNNNPSSKELNLTKTFELKEGDIIYFIFSNGNGGNSLAYPNGDLNILIF